MHRKVVRVPRIDLHIKGCKYATECAAMIAIDFCVLLQKTIGSCLQQLCVRQWVRRESQEEERVELSRHL